MKLLATFLSSHASRFQFFARTPAVIEPPETLEIRSSFGSRPTSLSRQSTPTWNTIAR